jgi:hypothetical protein
MCTIDGVEKKGKRQRSGERIIPVPRGARHVETQLRERVADQALRIAHHFGARTRRRAVPHRIITDFSRS